MQDFKKQGPKELSAATAENPVYTAAAEPEAKASASASAEYGHAGTEDAHGSGSAIPVAGTAPA